MLHGIRLVCPVRGGPRARSALPCILSSCVPRQPIRRPLTVKTSSAFSSGPISCGQFARNASSDGLNSSTPNSAGATTDFSLANEERWKSFGSAKAVTSGRCSDRSILLTGGTSGIGLAVAQRAVLEGASHVVIVTRDASKGQDAVASIREATGVPDPPVSYLNHDFSKSDPSAIKAALSPFQFNTLINCSGLSSDQLVLGQSHESAEQVWGTNYHMPFKLSQLLLKNYMQRASLVQRGRVSQVAEDPSWCIVNVSSLLAIKGAKGAATYAATKSALIALSRALALESGDLSERWPGVMPPIRVNTILPGYIETPMTQAFTADHKAKLEAQIPLRRFGKPAEVADAIMFLVHNEYANNCTLNLDGGLSAV